jgi:hypothetical protein
VAGGKSNWTLGEYTAILGGNGIALYTDYETSPN